MKATIGLLGLLMVSLAAAALHAAPSQPALSGQATGEFSQWADRAPHKTCTCVISGYTFCMDASSCAPKGTCVGTCPRS